MAAELTLGLELEIGAWSFWRTEERRRVRRGWPPENSGWTFQVKGPAGRCCARESGVLSGRARAADTTRMRAGWEPVPWGGRGPLAGAPIISSFTRAEGWLGSRWPLECGPGGACSGGASEGGSSRTHYPGLDTGSGWELALREEVRDRSRTHFLRPD